MKILIINDNGIEIGGVETYLSHLKSYLKKNGHDVRILTSKPLETNKNLFADYVFEGVNPKSLFRLLPYIFNINSLLKVSQVLKEFKPDVVHIHYFFYHTSPSILLALKNIPTIMTLHAHELLAPTGVNYQEDICKHTFVEYCIRCTGLVRYYPEMFKRFIFSYLKKSIDLYISPSNYYKKLYVRNGFSPILHIPNGIILEDKIKIPIRKKMEYQLLYVGRLVIEKGVEYIIKAIPLLKELYPKVHLDIVGSGEDETRLKKMVSKMKLNDSINFLGKVSNYETQQYYLKSDIVIVPSIYPDNLPTVCIEAKKYGKPLIVSNIGGIPELVNNNSDGLLVRTADSKDISEKVMELFRDNTKYSNFSMNSAKSAQNYLISEHIKKLLDIYKQVILNETK